MKNINYMYVKRIYSIIYIIIYILRLLVTAKLMLFYMWFLLIHIVSALFFGFDPDPGKTTEAIFSCLMLYTGFLIKWIGIIKVPFHYLFPILILFFCITIGP